MESFTIQQKNNKAACKRLDQVGMMKKHYRLGQNVSIGRIFGRHKLEDGDHALSIVSKHDETRLIFTKESILLKQEAQ